VQDTRHEKIYTRAARTQHFRVQFGKEMMLSGLRMEALTTAPSRTGARGIRYAGVRNKYKYKRRITR
jgi:hypothetical protein